MYLYLELWNVRPAWLALSVEQRAHYIEQVNGAMQGMFSAGAEVLTWSVTDAATDRPAGQGYFAVWKFPDAAFARQFEQQVAAAGWYDYFEQVNLAGAISTPQAVLGQLIEL
ncbi:MAG: hypothetical protein MUD01_08465 [Chloroflexaceae bacterium]|jgi:hypothetical protein|nr:hypothetical protein [Chloroflexaceae bacterium]